MTKIDAPQEAAGQNNSYDIVPRGSEPNPAPIATIVLETILALAASLGLVALGQHVVAFGVIGFLFYPLPLAVLVLRHGLKWGLGATVVLFLAAVFIFNIWQACFVLVECGVLGIFLGHCFRTKRSATFTLIVVLCITVLAIFLSIFAEILFLQTTVAQFMDSLKLSLHDFIESLLLMENAAIRVPAGTDTAEYIDQVVQNAVRLAPAVLAITAMLMAFLCYSCAAMVLRRFRYDIPRLRPFPEWRLNWRFAWLIILGLLCFLCGSQLDITWMHVLGLNLLYISVPILVLFGLSFMIWLNRFFKFGYFATALLALLFIVFFDIFMWLFMLMAIFEPLFDFRGKLIRLKNKSAD